MDLPSRLERFFCHTPQLRPLAAGDRIVVGFSGGPDSTALLLGFSQLAQRLPLELLAVHMDHGLDPGSADRATAAARLAARLGVPFVAWRREVPALRRPGESLEVAGRRLRYATLAAARERIGARAIATAHHRDDQAETVLLRLLFGSGIAGLAGIQPVRPETAVVRPFLDLPRSALAAAVAAAGLSPVDDPTNGDPAPPRNRLRHRLLPALAAADPDLPERLARLAARAAGARRRIEARLASELSPRVEPGDSGDPGGVSIERRGFARLPESLRGFALAALHRQAGAPYPASTAARAELVRQLEGPHAVGCDCGGGWRWEGRGGGATARLALRHAPHGFPYTLRMPPDRAGIAEGKTDGP